MVPHNGPHTSFLNPENLFPKTGIHFLVITSKPNIVPELYWGFKGGHSSKAQNGSLQTKHCEETNKGKRVFYIVQFWASNEEDVILWTPSIKQFGSIK